MPDTSDKDEKPVSRRARLQADGIDPEMPSLEVAYLVEYLFDVGPVLNSGMGPVALSFGELESWQALTGVPLQPWEARLLRRLSLDYLAESQKAKAPDCPPPWEPEAMTEKNRESVSRKVQNAMRSFIQSKAKS